MMKKRQPNQSTEQQKPTTKEISCLSVHILLLKLVKQYK